MAGGRRGPAPEPAAVKKAKGNSGRRPIATAEIEDAANEAVAAIDAAEAVDAGHKEIPPPAWLNEEGRKVWADLAPRLAAMKILQSIDANTFGRYCQDFGRWVQLQKKLDVEGMTYDVESQHGKYLRSNPAFTQAYQLNRSLIMMEGGFGLNPADRQRLFAARAQAANSPGLFDTPQNSDAIGAEKSPIGLLN